MIFQVESIGQGPEGAVKIQVMYTERPARPDLEDVQSNASSTYRRAYGAWPKKKPNAKVLTKDGTGWSETYVKGEEKKQEAKEAVEAAETQAA